MADNEDLLIHIAADIDELKGALSEATKLINSSTNKMTAAVEDFGDAAQKGFGKSLSGFKVFAANLASDVAFAALSALKDGFVAGAKSAMEFDAAVSEVNSLLGETGRLSKAQELALINLSSAYGGSAATQAKAYYQLVSVGITDTAQAMNILDIANKAAVAGLTDVETAINGITSVTQLYATEGINAAEASDILFNAVKQGKTTFPLLANNIGNVAPIAKAAGVSFQDLAGSVAFLTKATGKTEQTMTGMRALIQAIAAPSDELKKKAADMGISLGEAAIKSEGLTGIMRQIKEATGGSLTEITKIIPSIEGAGAAAAIASGDFDDFEKIMSSMQSTNGSTADAFAEIERSASFQFDVLKQELSNIPVMMMTLVNGPMADLIKGFRDDLPNSINLATSIVAGMIDAFDYLARATNFVIGAFQIMQLGVTAPLAAIASGIANLLELVGSDMALEARAFADSMTEGMDDLANRAGKNLNVFSENGLGKLADKIRDVGETAAKELPKVSSASAELEVKQNMLAKSTDNLTDANERNKASQKALLDLTKLRAEAETKLAESLATQSTGLFIDLEEEAAQLDARNEQRFIKDQEYYDAKIALEEERAEREKQILADQLAAGKIAQDTYNAAVIQSDKNFTKAKAEIEKEATANKLKEEQQRERDFSSSMGVIATLQSSSNKELAALGKAAAIYQATIDGYAAVQKALTAAPPPWNFALAAGVGAATAANVAKIAGAQLAGGIDSVPGIGTKDNFPAVLAPGERVVPTETNKDLKEFLANQRSGSTINMTVNVQSVAQNPDDVIEAINSALDKGAIRLRNEAS